MPDRPIALITGGTRGLGRAVAERLADEFELVLAYHADEAAAEQTVSALGSHEVTLVKVDISDPTAVENLGNTLRAKGRLDVLVHSAFRSGRPPKKTHELAVEDFVEDLGTNLIGAFTVCRAVLPLMMERGHGRIVLIGSLAMRGEPGRVAYSVAKSGLVGLAKTIAKEYAKQGITANVVNPGFIEAGAFSKLSPEIKARAVASVPMRRAGSKEEVAEAVAYLVGPASGYTTGQIIRIDGGAS